MFLEERFSTERAARLVVVHEPFTLHADTSSSDLPAPLAAQVRSFDLIAAEVLCMVEKETCSLFSPSDFRLASSFWAPLEITSFFPVRRHCIPLVVFFLLLFIGKLF